MTANMKRKKVFQIFMETSLNIYLYLCRHFIEKNIYKTNNLCYFNNCFYVIRKFEEYSIVLCVLWWLIFHYHFCLKMFIFLIITDINLEYKYLISIRVYKENNCVYSKNQWPLYSDKLNCFIFKKILRLLLYGGFERRKGMNEFKFQWIWIGIKKNYYQCRDCRSKSYIIIYVI